MRVLGGSLHDSLSCQAADRWYWIARPGPVDLAGAQSADRGNKAHVHWKAIQRMKR